MAKYYFDALEEDPERCYTLESFIDQMKYNGVQSMDIIPAEPFYGSGFFYCSHYGEAGASGECGKLCAGYKPRNGKNGRCISHGPMYTHSNKRLTIDVTGKIFESTNKT